MNPTRKKGRIINPSFRKFLVVVLLLIVPRKLNKDTDFGGYPQKTFFNLS